MIDFYKPQSLPDLLMMRSYSTRSISQQKQSGVADQQTEAPTPVIKYVLHDPKERSQISKMFQVNLKKRQIERDIQIYKSAALLNGVRIKQSQNDRFNLYLKGQQEYQPHYTSNPKIYLSKHTSQQNSPALRTSLPKSRTTLYFTNKKPQPTSPLRYRQLKVQQNPAELLGKTKLFTIVYKSGVLNK